MRTIVFMVVFLGAIILANAQTKPPVKAPAEATHEKVADSVAVDVKDIQLKVEQAQGVLKDAKLAVTDRERDLSVAVQKANADLQALLKAAGCEGCQLTEVAVDPKDPAGKKRLELIRPPAIEAKK